MRIELWMGLLFRCCVKLGHDGRQWQERKEVHTENLQNLVQKKKKMLQGRQEESQNTNLEIKNRKQQPGYMEVGKTVYRHTVYTLRGCDGTQVKLMRQETPRMKLYTSSRVCSLFPPPLDLCRI